MTATTPFVAAVTRFPFLTLVAMGTGEILEVMRLRCRNHEASYRHLQRFLRDYGCRTVVVESGCPLAPLAALDHLHVRRLSLRAAKRTLLNKDASTHAELYAYLLDRFPSLRRYTAKSPLSGRQDEWARWRNEKLLAVALALAVRFDARTAEYVETPNGPRRALPDRAPPTHSLS